MKLLLPLTLLATVAGVSAQEKCDADYIVEACLSSERAKVETCPPTDYDCLCAAHGAVATCYNNCPNDQRAPSARQAARSNCQNASMYGTKAKASKTSSMSASSTSDASATTTESDSASSTNGVMRGASSSSTSTARPTSTGAADALSGSTGGLFMAVAGVLAALL